MGTLSGSGRLARSCPSYHTGGISKKGFSEETEVELLRSLK